jgi:hypothetical protein
LEIQNSLWQQIVKAKYLLTKTVATVKMRIEDSPGWKALLKIKEYYFAGRKLILNKGGLVRFWIDPWLDHVPLRKSYPGLYDICQGQESTFEKVVGNGMIVPFRPRMPPVMLNQWILKGVLLASYLFCIRWCYLELTGQWKIFY